jgi:hypothetical protein
MWLPTINPQYDIRLLDRPLAGIHSVTVTSSRRPEPDKAEIVLPWGTELERGEVVQGTPVTIALGNTELGCGLVFVGAVETVERTATGGRIIALDRSTRLDDAGWTQEWLEGTQVADIIADLLAAAGLEAAVTEPTGRELPAAVYMEEQTAADTLAHLCGLVGLDYWIIPGSETMYVGPRWPYLHQHLTQEARYAFDLRTNEIISHRLSYKEQSEYQAVKLIFVDAKFTGEEPTIGRAAIINGELVIGEAAAGITPCKVIRQSGSADIDKANAEAQKQLLRMSTAGYEGTIVTHLNPYIRHSHLIRLEGGDSIPESNYPLEEVVYRFDDTGSEMELKLAPLADEER